MYVLKNQRRKLFQRLSYFKYQLYEASCNNVKVDTHLFGHGGVLVSPLHICVFFPIAITIRIPFEKCVEGFAKWTHQVALLHVLEFEEGIFKLGPEFEGGVSSLKGFPCRSLSSLKSS